MKGQLNNQNKRVQRKEKYGMRKLSVGFVSCMLGAVMVFSSVGGSFAAGAVTEPVVNKKQEQNVDDKATELQKKKEEAVKKLEAKRDELLKKVDEDKNLTDKDKADIKEDINKAFNFQKGKIEKAKDAETLADRIENAEDVLNAKEATINEKSESALETLKGYTAGSIGEKLKADLEKVQNDKTLNEEQKAAKAKELQEKYDEDTKKVNEASSRADVLLVNDKEAQAEFTKTKDEYKAQVEKDYDALLNKVDTKNVELRKEIEETKKTDTDEIIKADNYAKLDAAKVKVNENKKRLEEKANKEKIENKKLTIEEIDAILYKEHDVRDTYIRNVLDKDPNLTKEQKADITKELEDTFMQLSKALQEKPLTKEEGKKLADAAKAERENIIAKATKLSEEAKKANEDKDKVSNEEKNDLILKAFEDRNKLIDEIKKNSDLTKAQKDALDKKARDIFRDYKNKVEDDKLKNSEVKGLTEKLAKDYAAVRTEMKNVEALEKAKDKANLDLDEAVDNAIDAVNAIKNLTEGEKQGIVNKIEAIEDKAENDIEAATTPEQVKTILDKAIKDIADVVNSNILEDAKNQANLDLDEAVDNAIDAINARKDLTEAEKQALVNKVEAIEDKAENDIEAATTPEQVKAILDKAKKDIADAIGISDKLEDAKNQANLDLDKVVDDAIDVINAKKDLKEAEKQALVDKVEAIEDKAEDDIEVATTPEQVKTILDKAIKDIKAITDKLSNKGKGGYSGGGSSSSSSVVDETSSAAPSRRISGSDRIQTAVEVSKLMKNNKVVVLVNKDTFSDVLSATPFAHQVGAPILLTNVQATPQKTLDELARLGVEKIYIIGGDNSVSLAQEQSLKKTYKVERIKGSDRYETSAKIAEQMQARGSKSIVEVASGEVFADALSLTSKANKDNAPILLVKKDVVPKSISDFAKKYQATSVTVAGGVSTVSDTVANAIKANSNKEAKLTRLNGRDRYETAIAIAKVTMENSTKGIYTSGEVFADALVSGVYATQVDAPVLLVKRSSLPDSVARYNKESKINEFEVIGGNSTVSDATFEAIKTSLQK